MFGTLCKARIQQVFSLAPRSASSMHLRLLAFILLSPLVSFSASPLTPAGASSIDITPRLPGPPQRLRQPPRAKHRLSQHIFAKALALGNDSEGPAILVTVDNVGIPASMRAEVLRRLRIAMPGIFYQRETSLRGGGPGLF